MPLPTSLLRAQAQSDLEDMHAYASFTSDLFDLTTDDKGLRYSISTTTETEYGSCATARHDHS